jgi:hypothetical protein
MAVPRSAEAIARDLLAGQVTGKGDWEIAAAIDAVSRVLAGGAAEGLARPSGTELLAALRTLNDRRMFKHAVRLGTEAVRAHAEVAGLHRRLVQALIDSGDLDGAERALRAAEPRVAEGDPERLEIKGLWGRLAKQRYVAHVAQAGSGGEAFLRESVARYREVYEADRTAYWHGINAIALAAHAENGSVGLERPFDWRAASRDILRDREARFARRPDDLWSVATAAEACLALERMDEAELWLYRYATDAAVTPFMLASTDRQLREIWGVRREAAGSGRLLLILDRRLADSGTFQVEARRLGEGEQGDASYLERVFGKERFIGFDRWKRALDCCDAIARIEKASGAGVGTGFLVRGSALHPGFGDAPVLVTNAHVIDPDGATEGALRPADARVRFEVEARRAEQYAPLAVDRVLWTSPPGGIGVTGDPLEACDVTICALRGLDAAKARVLDVARRAPLVSSAARAFVVGHPDGDGLQFSIADSELLDIDDAGKLVHYRTPTVGGSSGSPVFDLDWNVFAVHHAGDPEAPRLHGAGTYAANEGISLGALAKAIAARPGGPR